MKMKPFRTCFFSIIFILSFSIYASAEDGQNNQTRDQIDDLITIASIGEFDDAEARNMVQRLHSIHDSLLQGLVEENAAMLLVNFPITQLEEFSHLQGIVPRGWENTGSTWDDVPGAGGRISVARIGYSESGMDHGSLNLELHEIAHPIDTYVLDKISESSAFKTIHKQEQALFLPDIYFEYPNEYFAEAFAYYFLNDETRALLQNSAPKTYEFFNMLEDVTTKETLNEAVEAAYGVSESDSTEELDQTLETAIAVNNNPEASSSEIRNAEFTLRQAQTNATEKMEERVDQLTTIVTKGEYDRQEAEHIVERINRMHNNLLQALIDHEITVKLINFPVTDLTEFAHLEGEYAENTDQLWDEAPGIGEQTVAVRIGYNNTADTINVELSEIARSIDQIIFDQMSSSPEFQEIHAAEQVAFLADSYYENPENYFAEAFAYFFLNEERRNMLMEQAPETYEFINNLQITSEKHHLYEVINEARMVDEVYMTEGFERNLTHALDISNNPYATQFDVDEAAALLSATLLEINQTTKEDTAPQQEKAEEITVSANISGDTPTLSETNAFSYLIISFTSILCGSVLLLRTFSLQSKEELIELKMPFQK